MKYLLAITLAAALVALWLFPRALPVVVLSDRIAREEALTRAHSFVKEHGLPGRAQTAIRFQRDDSLRTFVELAGGGKDSLDALVRGDDVAPYSWSVRHFTPRDVRETRVHLAADGRLIGFERRFAEADKRRALPVDSAQMMATHVLTSWLAEPPARWRLAATSYEILKASERVDRTFTFERADRRIANAPIRLDVVIAGDTPAVARRYVEIPETFRRRYGEMRSANELYSLIAGVALLGIIVAGAFALRRFSRVRGLRWREPFAVAAVIAILLAGVGLNEMPSQWYDYDTAMSATTFRLMTLTGALALAALAGLVTAITLVAAEAATRAAFPHHLDWWSLWKYRGTREVAIRVAGGYTLAAVALAYVVVFYLATQRLLGWWVPSELLDDPNLIATPVPWLAGIAVSLHAAVWEEAIFRALPLSLLSLWVASRPHRAVWMAGGVIASALVFGFAHASYPSWPAYSRGLEIFLDACLWAVVFLRFGLIVTVVAHFVYNATLFGMFAAAGTAPSYRMTAAIVILAILSPALIVAWRWIRQRGLSHAPAEARFEAWKPPELTVEAPVAAEPVATGKPGVRARKVAIGAIGLGVLAVLVAPATHVRGPRYSVSRAEVTTVADSMVASRGADAEGWKRLIATRGDTAIPWSRFVRHHRKPDLAATLATTYAVPVWWEVRYVRTAGAVSARAEEWRARISPDGVPIGVQHILPDSAPGARPDQGEARVIALGELARMGLDTAMLVEAKLEETAKPARLDMTVAYTDSTVQLPGGAAARVWVSLAGVEPVLVRRGVELPEDFIRQDRDWMMRRGLVVGASALSLIALVIIGATRVIRRRPPLTDEAGISRRALLAAGGMLGASMVASGLNDLPSMLFGYNTAETWSSFMTSSLLVGISVSVVFVLVFAGLWLTANALRRRVGIPVIAAPAGRISDAIIAGAAIGSVVVGFSILLAAIRSGIPPTPQTSLGQAVPLLSKVMSLPFSVFGLVPAIAIPLLVIVALARGWLSRLVLGLVLLALLAGIVLPLRAGPADPMSMAVSALAIVVFALAIRTWGGLGVTTWLAAAFAARALLALRGAIHAANTLDAWAQVLGVIAALGALAILVRFREPARDDRKVGEQAGVPSPAGP